LVSTGIADGDENGMVKLRPKEMTLLGVVSTGIADGDENGIVKLRPKEKVESLASFITCRHTPWI